MAYRVGSVVTQQIPAFEDYQSAAQDQELKRLTVQDAVEQRRAKIADDQAKAKHNADIQTFLQQALATHRHDNGRPDLESIADEFEKAYPEEGGKFRADLVKNQHLAAETKKMEFENHRDIGQISGRMLKTANPQNYAQVRQSIVQLDPDADQQLPPQFDPAQVADLIKRSEALTGEFDGKAKATDLFDKKPLQWVGENAQYVHSQDDLNNLYDDAALAITAPKLRELKRAYGEQYTGPEWNANAANVALTLQKPDKPANPANLQKAEFMLDGKRVQGTFNPDTGEYKADPQAKPIPPASAASGAGAAPDDAKAIAQGIYDGKQPPEFTGLYRMTGPVRAELQRLGYDLTKATEDWKAAQKHLSTLNGVQQTRLRQAVAFTSDSLDVIDDLNAQWKGGKFPLLNKAQLSAAKSGLLGPQAQTIATQLDSQISDLVSELGTVYKGGNSSTDESLKLAAENLKSNWSQKQMEDAVKLIRRNLRIRQNSIMNTGTVANQGNIYAPTTAAPTAPAGAAEWVWDAKLGKLVKKGGG